MIMVMIKIIMRMIITKTMEVKIVLNQIIADIYHYIYLLVIS